MSDKDKDMVVMTLRWPHPQPVTWLVIDEEKVAKMKLDELEAIARTARDQPDEPGNEETFDGAFNVDVALELIARVRVLERALLCACHAGENLEFAYEDAHRHALRREIERCGALVGRKPGDSAP